MCRAALPLTWHIGQLSIRRSILFLHYRRQLLAAAIYSCMVAQVANAEAAPAPTSRPVVSSALRSIIREMLCDLLYFFASVAADRAGGTITQWSADGCTMYVRSSSQASVSDFLYSIGLSSQAVSGAIPHAGGWAYSVGWPHHEPRGDRAGGAISSAAPLRSGQPPTNGHHLLKSGCHIPHQGGRGG
jgi:hypothetical protein